MVVAHLVLTVAFLVPQDPGQDPRFTSVLSKSEQSRLNSAAKDWFAAENDWLHESNPQRRSRLTKMKLDKKDRFMKLWDAKSDDQPMKHMGDLKAIFENVFPYDRQHGTGEIKKMTPKGGSNYYVAIPRSYKSDERYRTVLLIPGRNEEGWTSADEYFGATWHGSEFADDALFVVPDLGDGLELDPVPDLSTDTGRANETERIGALLIPAGQAQREFRFDRDRLILDAGKGANAYVLRLATYFPGRFAGLILRDPKDWGDLRLDSLAGLPVLMIADPEHKDVAVKLAKQLNDLEAGHATVLEAKGDYPYPDLQDEIGKWAGEHATRDLYRRTVVIAPNHDLYRKGYWVEIGTAEPLNSVKPEDRPYLKVSADRDANRIEVESKSVSAFSLLLNDAIVDLDKPFTVVVNGKAITEQRARNFSEMIDLMQQRFDPSYIFTTTYTTSVPKDEAAQSNGSGQ